MPASRAAGLSTLGLDCDQHHCHADSQQHDSAQGQSRVHETRSRQRLISIFALAWAVSVTTGFYRLPRNAAAPYRWRIQEHAGVGDANRTSWRARLPPGTGRTAPARLVNGGSWRHPIGTDRVDVRPLRRARHPSPTGASPHGLMSSHTGRSEATWSSEFQSFASGAPILQGASRRIGGRLPDRRRHR
jgi:hypothetical protein